MPQTGADILFLSSNARRLYAEDILTSLAAPPGFIIQFRYQTSDVAPELQRIASNGQLIGKQGLIAFRARIEDDDFVLPVRCVTVKEVMLAGLFFVLKLRIAAYPNLSQYPANDTALKTKSKDFLARTLEMNDNHSFAALTKFPTFDNYTTTSNEADSWFTVATRLAKSEAYANAYFARIETPKRDEQPLYFDESGTLRLTEEKLIKLVCHYYSEEDVGASNKKLVCAADSNFLRVSSTTEYPYLSRYDSVEFWLQPSLVNYPTQTLARVALEESTHSPTSNELASRVLFSVIIERSRSQVAARATLGGVGAFLLALPAILGSESDVWLRVVLAVLGALIISYVTVYMSAGRK